MGRDRVRIVVRGRVQRVGYRAGCRSEALRLGVAGTVRNRSDGSVEIVAEGNAVDLEEFTAWCRRGPRYASVEEITVTAEVPRKLGGFDVIG